MVSRTAALGLRAVLDSIGFDRSGRPTETGRARGTERIGLTTGALPRAPGLHGVTRDFGSQSTLSVFSELRAAGGRIGPMTSGAPTIAIGDVSLPARAHGVRLHVENGAGGCAPLAAQSRFDADGFAPAAIMAASLASLEMFRLNALGETDAGADVKIATLIDGMTIDELIAIKRMKPTSVGLLVICTSISGSASPEPAA